MTTQEQIQNAELEVKWVREYSTNGDPFQQKKAMQSLLEVIKTLSSHINDMQCKIQKLEDDLRRKLN